MRTHLNASDLHSRVTLAARLPRRIAGASVAALALGAALVACDRAAPTESGRTAARSSLAPSRSGVSNIRMGMPDDVGPFQGEEAAVAAVVTAWDAAWNAGDGPAIGALFTDDAEFINGRGQIAVGGAAIGAQHAVSLAGPFRGSHVEGRVRSITFLSGTTAVLEVDSQITGYAYLPPGTVETAPGVHRGRHVRVLVKRGGTWHIRFMQITSVAPAAG